MPVRSVRTSLNASRPCARSSTRALIIWRAFALSAKNAHRSLQADSLHRCRSRVRECPGPATMEVLQKIYKGRFSWHAAYGGEGERSLGGTPKPPPGAAPLDPASKKPTAAKLQKRSVEEGNRRVKEVSH